MTLKANAAQLKGSATFLVYGKILRPEKCNSQLTERTVQAPGTTASQAKSCFDLPQFYSPHVHHVCCNVNNIMTNS